MDARTNLYIVKNKAKLEKLIRENAPYKKILEQSKKLDQYIAIAMQDINKDRVLFLSAWFATCSMLYPALCKAFEQKNALNKWGCSFAILHISLYFASNLLQKFLFNGFPPLFFVL